MSIAAAKRRRKQAANGYTHLAKIGRPVYKKKAASTLTKRLAKRIADENARRQRGAKF